MDARELKDLRQNFGFVVAADTDPDLMGYLVNCYIEDLKDVLTPVHDPSCYTATIMHVLKEFVEHARETLRKNPPMTMTYMDQGIGVMLTNHQQLVMVRQKEKTEAERERAAGTVQITRESNAGGGMRGMAFQDVTVPITKGDTKKG